MKTYIRLKNIYFGQVLSNMKKVISVDLVLKPILCLKLAAILDFEPFNDEEIFFT